MRKHLEKTNKFWSTTKRKILTMTTLMALMMACNSKKEIQDDRNLIKIGNFINLGNDFITRNNKVYKYDWEHDRDGEIVNMEIREIKNIADPKTFEIIDCFMGKDSLNVYFLFTHNDSIKIMEWADPDTFKEWPWISDTTEIEHAWHCFYSDKDHLYHMESIIEWVNPNTADLSSRWYDWTIKDQGHIFIYDGQKFIQTK